MKTHLQRRVWTKPLAAILGFSFLIPFTTAEARITFNSPIGLGVPGRRVAGGARLPDCVSQKQQRLTAIVPKNNLGLTTAANPTLFFYIPQTTAPELELVVHDNNKGVFKQSYKPIGKAGVIAVPLTQTSLEVGKEYHWFFSVICNPKERSQDQVVEGGIKRIQPSPQLMTKLKNATPEEQVNLYAAQGIWYDSLATLAQLVSSRPDNAQFKADWEALLTAQEVGLGQELARAPLF
ncbi:MAG: DUF928 domain-containing protein [Stigonema ocellatum SAG 48.90 = DSM 106950]|nr:DUF928 domain-containing protein [Stigonema ocellatum SAG 48.90 = DSM 106950]